MKAGFEQFFVRGTKAGNPSPSGRDRPILPARVANQNRGVARIFQMGGGHTVSNIIVMAFSPRNIEGCLLKKGLQGGSRAPQDPPSLRPCRTQDSLHLARSLSQPYNKRAYLHCCVLFIC